MTRRSKRTLLALVLGLLAVSGAQAQESGWQDARGAERFPGLDWLVGEWQGYGIFPRDTTFIHKRFAYEIGGVFLVERTVDVFPADSATTEFQLHQDFRVYYRTAAGYRSRGFFVEGFVWSSALNVSSDGDTIVIKTERVDGASADDMRARVTIVREGPDEFSGLFELANPGGQFFVLERQRLRRID